jgi:hypothetical protein
MSIDEIGKYLPSEDPRRIPPIEGANFARQGKLNLLDLAILGNGQPQGDITLCQGLEANAPEPFRSLMLDEIKAIGAFYKGSYKEAEDGLRKVIERKEDLKIRGLAAGMWHYDVLPNERYIFLAQAIHKQGKDASLEFDRAIERAKAEPLTYSDRKVAELYLGKSDNLMSRKDQPADPEAAAKACTEGITLLNTSKDEKDRKVLAALYGARAEALLALKKPEEAAADLRAARESR